MTRLTTNDVDWNSLRGTVFADAKNDPGKSFIFQGEYGMIKVTYQAPIEPMDIGMGVMTDGTPGHWYEVNMPDKTRVQEVPAIGNRIYDE